MLWEEIGYGKEMGYTSEVLPRTACNNRLGLWVSLLTNQGKNNRESNVNHQISASQSTDPGALLKLQTEPPSSSLR